MQSQLNPADLGTRKGVRIEEIDADSKWINGMDWMIRPLEELRSTVLKNVKNVKCEKEQLAEIRKEQVKAHEDLCRSEFHLVLDDKQKGDNKGPRCFIVDVKKSDDFETNFAKKIKERLLFSKYLINPNRFNFNKVVRIFALVLKCAKIWFARNERTGRKGRMLSRFSSTVVSEKATKPLVEHKSVCARADLQEFVMLSHTEVQYSLDYFFKKASDEVKSFVHPKYYENISFEKDNILYFTGRVLLDDITFKCKMTNAMIDLSTGTFIVPIVEKYSPLAFSIMNETHWYDPTVKHSGDNPFHHDACAYFRCTRFSEIVQKAMSTVPIPVEEDR